jgi:hypothetical protein
MPPLVVFGDHSPAEQAKRRYDNRSFNCRGEKRQEVETHVAAKILWIPFRHVLQ